MVMLMTQTAVRTLLDSGQTNPRRVLETLNRTIYNNVQRMDSDKTLTLCLLDYTDGEVWKPGRAYDSESNAVVNYTSTTKLRLGAVWIIDRTGEVDRMRVCME